MDFLQKRTGIYEPNMVENYREFVHGMIAMRNQGRIPDGVFRSIITETSWFLVNEKVRGSFDSYIHNKVNQHFHGVMR